MIIFWTFSLVGGLDSFSFAKRLQPEILIEQRFFNYRFWLALLLGMDGLSVVLGVSWYHSFWFCVTNCCRFAASCWWCGQLEPPLRTSCCQLIGSWRPSVFWRLSQKPCWVSWRVHRQVIDFTVDVISGLPQFLRNYKNKSTHGMSFLMVIMWTIGDIYKTTYFLVRQAPMQFWICGMLQVSCLNGESLTKQSNLKLTNSIWNLFRSH